MKIKYLCGVAIMLIIILVGNLSAAEWDNIKVYDKNTKTVTVKNWLGVGGEIGNAQLISPVHNLVAPGYRKVAEFRVRSFEDYSLAIKNFKFYDLNDHEKEVTKNIDLKYKDYEFVTTPKKEWQCSDVWNKTLNDYTEICGYAIVGEINKLEEVWRDFSLSNFNEGETLTIGIFTDVKAGDSIEWIPNIFGVDVPEWSTWTADLNVGLLHYYKLNETTGMVLNSINQSNNGTNHGATRGVAGKVNNAFDFEQSDPDYVNASDTNYTDFSISAWIKVESNATINTIVSQGNSNFPDPFDLRVLTDNRTSFDYGANGDSTTVVTTWKASPGIWYHVVAIYNATSGASLYINNLSNGTSATTKVLGRAGQFYIGRRGDNSNYFDGIIDEVGIWNRSLTVNEINILYNNGNGLTYSTSGDVAPIVTALDPPNATLYQTSPTTVNFTCHVSDDKNLTQVEFYLNQSLTYTNSSGINNTNYSFTVANLGDNIYNWSCKGYDNNSQSTSSTLRWFTVDSTPPTITVNYPNTSADSFESGKNLTLNISIEDLSTLDICYYRYNSLTNYVACNVDNNYTITNQITYNGEWNNITIYANDSLGNSYTSTFNWTVDVVDYGLNYVTPTIEGNLEDFNSTIKVRSGLSISDVNLIYNGSSEGGSTLASGTNTTILKNDLIVPQVSGNSNATLYWSILLSNGNLVNLTRYGQYIYNLAVDNCSGYSYKILQFQNYDEEHQTLIPNSTIETAFNLYTSDRTLSLVNVSNDYTSNPTSICLSINLSTYPSANYSMDTIVKYSADNYATEYYNIVDYFLTDIELQNFTLYDLNSSDSTEFQFTFTGDDYLPVENALVYVERQYISENQFKTVELPKTDSNGQTILHLVRNDVIYNIRVMKNGVVLGNFENIVAFCEDVTIGDCKINLNSADSNADLFAYTDLGITFTAPYFNETTRYVYFTFVSVDGTTKTVFMNVSKDDIFGNKTVCNNGITSTGASLSCYIPTSVSSANLRTKILVNGEEILIQNIPLSSSNYGAAGYLILLAIAISFISMFSGSKNGIIISIIITFVGGISFSLLRGDLFGYGASGIWLVTICIIAFYKLNKNRAD